MTAEQMFNKLLFYKVESGEWCTVYAYEGVYSSGKFVFWYGDKSVDVPAWVSLSMEILDAINAQRKELGWIK